jgi:hypothetical protein
LLPGNRKLRKSAKALMRLVHGREDLEGRRGRHFARSNNFVLMLKVKELPDVVLRISRLNSSKSRLL